MVSVDIKCPNCGNTRAFTIWCVAEYRVTNKKRARIHQTSRGAIKSEETLKEKEWDTHAYATGVCTGCKQPVLLMIQTKYGQLIELRSKHVGAEIIDTNIRVTDYFPKPPEPEVHDAYPEKIKDLFSDLQEMLDEGKSPALIVGGCRAVLEEGIKKLSGEGKSLYKRIKNLSERGVLTEVMTEWAKTIKDTGNAGLHEVEATREDAQEMVDFTRIFLEYGFVLPARIKQFKQGGKTDAPAG